MEVNKIFSAVGGISTEGQKPSTNSTLPKAEIGPSFQDQLQKALQKAPAAPASEGASALKFSHHAVDRMMSRGIQYSKADMKRLSEAVDRASAKGSRDSLILMNDSALIVSVKNKTVVTVMDRAQLKENVFTNIDSTIVL